MVTARVAVVALVSLLAAAAAAAYPPGGNGLIAYVRTDPASEIWVVAPDGSGRRRLTAGGAPAWSPDGRRIAFARGGLLMVASADGTDERVLQPGAGPAWSPDASRLAYSRFGQQSPGDSDLWVIASDGGEPARLTSGPERDTAPSWSPDGTRIAFERVGAIGVMAGDGTDQRRLVGGGGTVRGPSFSSDSSRLAFERGGAVFTIAADGSGPEQRISPSNRWSLGAAWAPDGTRIAFLAGGAVCTARLDGSDARRVTFDNAFETTYDVGSRPPSWQPVAGSSAPDSPYSCADPRWDLEISLIANRRAARIGDVAVFRVRVRNRGPEPATQTRVVTVLPEESDVIATFVGRGDCEESRGGAVVSLRVCNPGLLFPGEEATFTFSVIVRAPGPALATAQQPIYSQPADVNGENDSARATVVVAGCTITGTFGADVLRGTPRRDVICGLDGDDVVRGLGGNDEIWAGRGADVVEGGPGADRVLGGSGRDDLAGGDGDDVIWGGYGRDLVAGGSGDDSLHGGERGGRTIESFPYPDDGDRVDGGPGADVVDGGVGADRLSAGAGNDLVIARDVAGRDFASCGSGRDRLLADRYDRQTGCERIALTSP